MSDETLYRLCVVAGALIGTACALQLAAARIPAVHGWRLVAAIVLTATLMLVGARLYGFVEAEFGTSAVGIGNAGQREPGATIAVLICFPLFVRLLLPGVSVIDLMDAVAPSVSVALIAVRVGCLVHRRHYRINMPVVRPMWHGMAADGGGTVDNAAAGVGAARGTGG